jgi:CubicO group peptidase (beta-lactamase class C family)
MANLELGVPIEPDMVFRLGSITKQFTAVAILMLAEEGQLALDDAITKFLPDYPTPNGTITVEHLLTHTAGIKNYTDMAQWLPMWRKDFLVHELIDFFKSEPMQFAPGERHEYCNSGYILLGAVIEKISGKTYEQFIQHRIFDRLGMKHSYYDTALPVIPRRVAGYEKSADGYTNADYLSMTQPYAAGALASSVDDLALWDAALYTDKLLSHTALRSAFLAHILADGSTTEYGYGWDIAKLAGHSLIGHDGAINGFLTYAIRLPEDHVFVAVLSNNGGVKPDQLAFQIAASAIGKPFEKPTPIQLDPETLARYEGDYRGSTLGEWHVTRDGNRLLFQSIPDPALELLAVSSNEFFIKERWLTHLTFVSDANGAVTCFELRGAVGNPAIANRVDKSATRGT